MISLLKSNDFRAVKLTIIFSVSSLFAIGEITPSTLILSYIEYNS